MLVIMNKGYFYLFLKTKIGIC